MEGDKQMNLLQRINQLHEPGADVWLFYLLLSLITWYAYPLILGLSTLAGFFWFQTAPALLKKETRKIAAPHIFALLSCGAVTYTHAPGWLTPLLLFSGFCVAITLFPEVVSGTAKLHHELKEAR
jgi:hypothetical protein